MTEHSTAIVEVAPNEGHFQGELYIGPVVEIPDDIETTEGSREGDDYIVGHSETGHHHVVAAGRARLLETDNTMIAYIEARDSHVDLVHKRDHDTHPTLRLNMASSKGGKRTGRKITRQREVTPEAAGRPVRWDKAAD